MYTTLYILNMPCFVPIVDYTCLGSAIASFMDLVAVARRISPIKQLQPPLDLVTISMEHEVHKLNSKTEHGLPNDKNRPNTYVGFPDNYHSLHCFTGSRNTDWNIWSCLVLKLWWMNLLYAIYEWEGTEKQTNKSPWRFFFLPSTFFFFLRVLWIYYLRIQGMLGVLLELISAITTVRSCHAEI